jgi:hypothetical protein
MPPGWGPPQGVPPPMPPPVPYGLGGGNPYYYGQPSNGGRGRGRGGGNANQNLVTRVKAEIRVARPGQVLEIARDATRELASRSPELYLQFREGLGKGSVVGSPPVTVGDNNEKGALRMIVADRKAAWQKLCAEDADVFYWVQTQSRIKADKGANADVDRLIVTDETVNLRQYFRGKEQREKLLNRAGLAREGSALVAIAGSEYGADQPESKLYSEDEGDWLGEEVDENSDVFKDFMATFAKMMSSHAANRGRSRGRGRGRGNAVQKPSSSGSGNEEGGDA